MNCPLCKTGKHSASCCPLSDAGRIDEPIEIERVDAAWWERNWQSMERLGLAIRKAGIATDAER